MKYFFLIPYYNLHFTPFLDELASLPDAEVTVGLLDPADLYRPGFGWDDTIDKNIYKRVYVGEVSLSISTLRQFDVICLLGIYAHLASFRTAWLSLYFTKAAICIFSEGLKPKKWANRFAKTTAIKLLNHPRVTLMAIGTAAAEDYRALGAKRWRAYRFGFTVNRNRNVPVEMVRAEGAPLRCISVGQLIERKRVGDLIKAAGILIEKEANISIDIFGGGSLKEQLVQCVQDGNLEETITFCGVVTHANLFKILPDYDCLVLCSSYDGWGAVVNEAMQAGLTVVLARGVRAAQLIVIPQTGFIYPTGDVDALALALQKLSEDESLLLSYRRNAFEAIKDYFPEILAKRYNEIMCAYCGGKEEVEFSTSLNRLY